MAAYKKQIKDMTINLGSEIYGAEYFVDICYRVSHMAPHRVPPPFRAGGGEDGRYFSRQ